MDISFRKDISQKVNVRAIPEFELTYFEMAVHNFGLYAMQVKETNIKP